MGRQYSWAVSVALLLLAGPIHALPSCEKPESEAFQGGLFLETKSGKEPHIVYSSPYTGDFSRYFFDKNSTVGKKILSVCNQTDSCWIKGKVCARDVSMQDTSWAAWIVTIDQIKRKPKNILVEEILGWIACEKAKCRIDYVGPNMQDVRERKSVYARYFFDAKSKVGKKVLSRCKSGGVCNLLADVKFIDDNKQNSDLAAYVPGFEIMSVENAQSVKIKK
jgi:NADH:ubiquinone oxidoreductase subunit E